MKRSQQAIMLAGRSYLRLIRHWRAAGYRIQLIFLALNSPAQAAQRVATRVRLGGHDIPLDIIHRRFNAGWYNFNNLYKHCVDHWQLWDNSGHAPILKQQVKTAKAQSMNDDHLYPLPDLDSYGPDTREVYKSLYRAACRAHLLAHQNGQGVIIERDGQVIEIPPEPEKYNFDFDAALARFKHRD